MEQKDPCITTSNLHLIFASENLFHMILEIITNWKFLRDTGKNGVKKIVDNDEILWFDKKHIKSF